MNPNDLIGQITTLKGKENDQEALNILRKVAAQVKPIMKKRGWKVGILAEFSPTNPNLLGTNYDRGSKISLRLRNHSNDRSFLQYESVLMTMLHELVHIVCGPHNAQFYKTFDEIKEECEGLMNKGYFGDGFFGIGHRVGDGVSHNLSPAEARAKALEAIEKRRKLNELMMPAGGRRLGGSSVMRELEKAISPGELAAFAVERRLRDSLWCENESSKGGDQDIDEGSNDPQKAKGVFNNGKNKNALKQRAIPSPKNNLSQNEIFHDSHSHQSTPVGLGEWTCDLCTLVNNPLVLRCAACLMERPKYAKSVVAQSDEVALLNKKGWHCPQCTLLNEDQWWICQICEYVRVN